MSRNTVATSCLYRLRTLRTPRPIPTHQQRQQQQQQQQQHYHAAANFGLVASAQRSSSNTTLTLPTSEAPSSSSQQCLSTLGSFTAVRSAHTSAVRRAPPPTAPGRRPPPPPVDPLKLVNGQIPFAKVQLVDEDNKLGDPTSLKLILKTFDHNVDVLRLVQVDPPVVKILNIEDEKTREREHEAKLRLSRRIAFEDKELQVPWHAAVGDLQHKANTARSLLEKGDRVHLVFARRAGGGQRQIITDADKEKIVALFAEALSPIASRWREDDRTRKAIWVSYWQPLEAIRTEVRKKILDGIVEKRVASLDKKEERRLREQEKQRKAAERAKAKGL